MPQYVVYEDSQLTAYLSSRPTTLGHTIVTPKQHPLPDLFSLSLPDFTATLLSISKLSTTIRSFYHVRRCALVTDGRDSFQILPLHGLSEKWQPVISGTKEFHDVYPGYVTSIDGPTMSDERLDEICGRIREASGVSSPFNNRFDGDPTDDNLFSRIVRGELQQWRVWEDEGHVAFLSPFANTAGFTVLVPRVHLSSNILALEADDYVALIGAAYTVAGVLKRAFGLERCGMIFEGFEIDYAHIKLIPIHEVGPAVVQETGGGSEIGSKSESAYQEKYQGYVTSLPGPLLEDVESLESDAVAITRLLNSSVI